MIRTRKEWLDWGITHGTNGEMVFDILKDWKEQEEKSRTNFKEMANKYFELFDMYYQDDIGIAKRVAIRNFASWLDENK